DDSGDIRRANLDGSGQETLVIGLAGPRGIALDLPGGKMYWAERFGGDIGRANLDGSGQEILLQNLNTPLVIALDLPGGKMYWTERAFSRDLLHRASALRSRGQRRPASRCPFLPRRRR